MPLRPSDNLTQSWQVRKYVEVDLPIEELSPVATREANSRKPIYQIHKWWARRLGSTFRALLLASFTDYIQSPDELRFVHSSGEILKDKVILDPMMGGGTTIVEGLRLGCRVVGVDINPVAWFVTKKEVEPLDLVEINKSFEVLEMTVGKRIIELYQTSCPEGHHAQVIYVLWCKHLVCKCCSKDITLVRDYVVSKKGEERIVFCPNCLCIFPTRENQKTSCPRCGNIFDSEVGPVKKGMFSCPNCHEQETIRDAVKRYGGPLPLKMLCIEYYCRECGRGYKEPSSLDLEKYRYAEERWTQLKNELPFPEEIIPMSSMDSRPASHGYRYFHEMFNARQLLSLSLLLQGIIEIGHRSTREFLLLVFSSCLETNNMFCKYETNWQKISSCFGIPTFHPVERIAENNVWGTVYGRGTFTKCYRKLIRAKSKKAKSSKLEKAQTCIELPSDEYEFTDVALSFEELTSSNKKALLTCGNSESLEFLPSSSIDLVLTDPPYFDNLNYSRLADFFYVWLRKGLRHEYPEFSRHSSAHEREIVMDGTSNRNLDNLTDSLSRVFSECHRVLKRSGLLVFTFHHRKLWAWRGIAQALCNAKFTVVATHYVRSEGCTGFRKNGNISYDVCVVCRKSAESRKYESCDNVIRCSEEWIQRLIKAGNNLKHADICTIIMGESLNHAPSLLLSDSSTKFIESLTEACAILADKSERENA